jgi:hypothetical protein
MVIDVTEEREIIEDGVRFWVREIVFYPNMNNITLGELSTCPAQDFNYFIRIVRVWQ